MNNRKKLPTYGAESVGTLVLFSAGCYDEEGPVVLARLLRPVDLHKAAEEFLTPYGGNKGLRRHLGRLSSYDFFCEWLEKQDYICILGYQVCHLGAYEDIAGFPESWEG